MILLDLASNRSWADLSRDPARNASALDVPQQFLTPYDAIRFTINHARWVASVDLPRYTPEGVDS